MAAPARSMTGFGAAQGPLSDRLEASVRLVSLNARFLEVAVRTQPRIELEDLELALRRVLAAELQRGRVQVLIELTFAAGRTPALELHWEVAEALLRALAARPHALELAPLSLRDLLALPGFAEGGGLAVSEGERDALLALVAAARDALVAMRTAEAAELLPHIDAGLGVLAAFCGWLVEVNGELAAALARRLRERLAALLDGVGVAEERLAMEAAVLADRADTSEEQQRLAAHLEQCRRVLGEGGAVGKKLDFLVQEMLREVNTAGSKCRELGIGGRVVEAKAALEKLREQIANLE